MRKISEMYERSGGAMWERRCNECKYCIIPEEKTKHVCHLHPEKPQWKTEWTACKWFIDKSSLEEHQISMFEL